MGKIIRFLLLLLAGGCHAAAHASPPPPGAGEVLELTLTYSIYAKTLWHPARPPEVGGFWGDGLADKPEKNGNGNVRGMCNTLLGYALLIHAIDEQWLTPAQLATLQAAGLGRSELLDYIRQNLDFLIAHHISNANALSPKWGLSWQSSLWLGAAGPAVLLAWKDLPENTLTGFKQVVAAEADRMVSKPPKNYKPGDTGAEENAWDTHAPAVALAIEPNHPHRSDWLKALETYAVNVYSTPGDNAQYVCTANLFADFTLENHGFFHPDYMQVSGQHLGEALLYLQMGDRINFTRYGDLFDPYARHNLTDVWQNVMRPLLQGNGEFAFPNGTDWTLHSSLTPSYLACISTLLNDPLAEAAERVHLQYALRHRAVSPPGRILGDTNLEWWWEPLLIKRCATALLQHEYRPNAKDLPAPTLPKPGPVVWKQAKAFAFGNSSYFVTVSWGARHMGTFAPNKKDDLVTLPQEGILPKEVETMTGLTEAAGAQSLSLRCKDGQPVYLVCLPHSVVWISPKPFRALAIENDRLSGGSRAVASEASTQTVAMLSGKTFDVKGQWVNIAQQLGLIGDSGESDGFRYTSPKDFNRKSAAYDEVMPNAARRVWQMVPQVNAQQTQALARALKVSLKEKRASITVQDGNGERYEISADLAKTDITVDRIH